LANASLDDPESGLDAATVEHIQNPPQHQLSLDDDPDLKAAVKLYLKLSHAGKDYEAACEVLMESKDVDDFPTLYQAKRAVEQLSGISGIMHDMCFNSCIGFTGQFVHLESCPICSSLCYDQVILTQSKGKKKVARKHKTKGELLLSVNLLHTGTICSKKCERFTYMFMLALSRILTCLAAAIC
ncbi:uncharacterized protein F5147DRAFT_588707, partial [Suillus discolor]